MPRRFLVTAGNTRERIDHVRDWGNIFTGNTGLQIARALADAGGDVHLLTSNRAHVEQLSADGPDSRITTSSFTDHAELRGALAALMAREPYDAVFMSAAVADYRPAGAYEIVIRESDVNEVTERWLVTPVQAGKIKSSYPAIAILGERTEKLVDLFRTEWKHRGLLVKFKLEVGIDNDELIRIGQSSRKASGAEYLVANTLEMVDGPAAGAFLLSDAGEEWVPRDQLPRRLADVVRAR
jgi:phosphopantothenate---cysteine ligase (CTP)